jgi:hypothetical protein
MEQSGFGSKHVLLIIGGVFLCAVAATFFVITSKPQIIHITTTKTGSPSGAAATSGSATTSVATNIGSNSTDLTDPASENQILDVQGQELPQQMISPLDTTAYDAKLLQLANIQTKTVTIIVTSTIAGTSTIQKTKTTKTVPVLNGWPVKTAYPDAGALLPANRIVAYYGNFYSTAMGVLGEEPPQQMLQMLQTAVAQWQAADPSTPVIPALDYIAVTAQGSPGPDGKYRDRMPASQIEEAISLANQVHGLVFLDIQVGLSNLQTEVPLLAQYLKMPNVELSVDPEFSMKDGAAPGTEIGTFDASDINWTANYLANIVQQNNLTPKILVVHRFTQDMVTNYKEITPLPQVQIVMDMDGWGDPAKKENTYEQFIEDEPVEFTGFKLFYKADLRPPSTRLLTPQEILNLTPIPSYIQYQ